MLDEELCQPKKCGLECIVYCPVNKTGGECIVQRPEDGKAVISEELYTGCGICIKKCPFDAIVIVNLAKEIGDHKIHQYGINSFRLYHIPLLKKRFSSRTFGEKWNREVHAIEYIVWKY